MARICMVGTGYVGLVSGACFADFGHEVRCVDINEERIKKLRAGEIPFFEPGLDKLVKRNRDAGQLRFTTELAEGMEGADVVMIAVQTPSGADGEADLQFVMKVGEQVASLMKAGDYKVICTKSTVPVGTSRKLKAILVAHAPKGAEFDVTSNPEFLREGSSIEDFMRPDRVVIGTESERAEKLMRSLYRPLYLLDTPIVSTDIETSELIKYASNSFLAVKISFINELANLCEAVNADIATLAKAMGLDRRIGPKFLHAGLGFGGSCLPKDTRASVHMGKENGLDMQIIAGSIAVNESRALRAMDKLKTLSGDLKGKKVAVLGLAFKPNTDDVREAPSLVILPALKAAGATIKACDPEAMQSFRRHFEDFEISKNPYEAAAGADAVLLLTEWNPYRELDLERLKETMSGDVFLDCRNVYSPARMRELGFRYDCFGRK